MKHPCRTISLIAVTVILLTGCSIRYPYRLLLSVKDDTTELPVPGITVNLDTLGKEEDKFRMDFSLFSIPKSDADGRVTFDFDVHLSEGRHWYLKLKKEGYEDEVVDIKPVVESTDPKNRVPLKVDVRLRPVE